MKIFKIAITFTAVFTLGMSSVLAEKNTVNSVNSPRFLISLLNVYDTPAELLETMQHHKVISLDEKTKVLDFLSAQNIPYDTKLHKGRMKGNKLILGASSMTYVRPGVWRTKDDHVIHLNKNSTFDQNFIFAFKELTRVKKHKRSALLIDLIFPHADAQDFMDFANATGDAVVGGFMTGMNLFLAPTLTGLGYATEFVKIRKGTIICRDNKYFLHNGYRDPSWSEAYEQNVDAYERFPSPTLGYSKELAAATQAGASLTISNIFPNEAPLVKLPDDMVKKVLRVSEEEDVPDCNGYRADIINRLAHTEAQAELDRLTKGEPSANSGAKNQPPQGANVQ